MRSQTNITVNNYDFIKELTNEVNVMKTDGTTYRRETAELSLFVARKVKNTGFFYNREMSYRTVSNILLTEDVYRLWDVAKMLNVVLLDLHGKANRSHDIEICVIERSRKRKPVKLVPVT